ncbi:glycosyltransferase family 2 protein [Rhodobacterales bacterium]|nr:glycosyltransferase family 2 protein [Rhodobacterales bacterium]
MDKLINIVIPTYNRARHIRQAVEAALGQSYPNSLVTVIDDASTDETRSVLAPWFGRPDFNYIRLKRNLGTAHAKNVGLLFSGADAWTFHDSDDLPRRDKVLRQARVLANPSIEAHPCLNWELVNREPNSTIRLGAVLTHHEILLPDGERVEIRRTLSLVDDFFPNLQMAAGVPGDWTHVNSGLFHGEVFESLGGFADCVEEDREFRNRLLMAGEVVWVIPDILLTKIETPDSLTQSAATNYDSERRLRDRRAVWDQVERWFRTRTVDPVPIDVPGLDIAEFTNPDCAVRSRALAAPATAAYAASVAERFAAPSGLKTAS